MLKIEITDDSCEDEEAYHLEVPLGSDRTRIMEAIDVLFPTATRVTLWTE